MAWAYLIIAILSEVLGTLGLRSAAGAPRWWTIALIAIAYSTSFWFMALALRQLKVGVVYAIWSAVGTAAVTTVGFLVFGERISWQAVAGMALIVAGVFVLVGSGTVTRSAA